MPGSGVQSSEWSQLFEDVQGARVFMMFGTSFPAGANFSHVQLFNPAASSKNVQALQAWIEDDGGNMAQGFINAAALSGLSGFGKNFKAGSAVSIAEIRHQEANASFGAIFAEAFTTGALQVAPFFHEVGPQLGPGEGLIFQGSVAAIALHVRFMWAEYDA